MEFFELKPQDKNGIAEMSAMATEIVRDHFDPIIGKAQNDYMIARFQTVEAIEEQLAHGSRYYFAELDGRRVGFLAFYPKNGVMYLSKFYLFRQERGKGYAWQMLEFLKEATRQANLKVIELNVNRNNSAIFAYEKMGFKVAREEKNDIGAGFFMDDYVYALEV